MKKKGLLVILSALCLLGACGTHDDLSSGSPANLVIDLSYPSGAEENYQWQEREYKAFPSYPTIASNLNYQLSDDQSYYIVSRSSDTSKASIIIPTTYNDLPVKEIATEGFAYLSQLSTIYIPSSITKIGNGAFNGTALKTVYYDAQNVEDLNAKNWVFYPSDNQSINFYIGPSVERIPNRLFFPLMTNPSLVPHVRNIYFDPDCQVKEIGDYAFYKLSELKAISLPDSVESIGDYAFYECGLDDIILPSSLKTVGRYAFAYNSIKHVRFNECLEDLGNYAFYSCKELEYLNLTSTILESLSNYAFANCLKLTTLLLPNSLKRINCGAFKNNVSLNNLNIHNNVEIVEEESFYNCSSLGVISLGTGLKVIGNRAFASCVKVNRLMIKAANLQDLSNDNGVFMSLGKETDNLKVLLWGVNYIPKNLFFASGLKEEQPHIQQLVLDNTINEIGENALFNLAISEISYVGTISQWNDITIHDYNTILNDVVCYHNQVEITID